MIEIHHLPKRFGKVPAVDDLSFRVDAGQVTGFLGPNGAGKNTTMRAVIGLDRPDHGEVTFDGEPYLSFRRPLHEVGHSARRRLRPPTTAGRDHLGWLAPATESPPAEWTRCSTSSAPTDAARRRVGGYSLGMRQRLGLAGARSATRTPSCSTNPPTDSTPKGSGGSAACSSSSLSKAAPSSCRATCCRRWPRWPAPGRVTEPASRHFAGLTPDLPVSGVSRRPRCSRLPSQWTRRAIPG